MSNHHLSSCSLQIFNQNIYAYLPPAFALLQITLEEIIPDLMVLTGHTICP